MRLMKPTLQRIVALRCILGDMALHLPLHAVDTANVSGTRAFRSTHFAIPVSASNRPGFVALFERNGPRKCGTWDKRPAIDPDWGEVGILRMAANG